MGRQTKLFGEEKQTNNHYKAETYKGIYALHKYWSKKPFNIIRNFIIKYSKNDDIVLDPFCGSGVTISEALISQRRPIGIDINPAAKFITEQVAKTIDIHKLLSYFESIEKDVKDKINSFYETEKEGIKCIGSHFIWENNKLTEVWTKEKGNRKKVFKPTNKDIQKAHSYKYEDIEYFYPTDRLFYNPRINAYFNQKVHHLFTPRNLYALSLLYDRINQIEETDYRNIFKFIFTAALGQTTKMVFVVKQRGKTTSNIKREIKEVGSWVIGYWTPKEFFEINVWNCFVNRFNKIYKAKKAQKTDFPKAREIENFDQLKAKGDFIVKNDAAQNYLKSLPDNSIDYIITDPPHGNRIPYLELSLLWNSWLNFEINYNDEIIISDSRERKKTIEQYNELMKDIYFEIYRVLKPNKYFTLMFNSLDDKTWINLLKTLNALYFKMEPIETLGYSANSVVQDNRQKGLKTDFVFTFYKSEKPNPDLQFIDLKDKVRDEIISDITDFLISNKNQGVETYLILNHIISLYLQKNKFFRISELNKLLKNNFTANKNKWYVKLNNNG